MGSTAPTYAKAPTTEASVNAGSASRRALETCSGAAAGAGIAGAAGAGTGGTGAGGTGAPSGVRGEASTS
ncbi:hypothetical protein GCM10010336_35160 [Streptomyces goshikiensis]|nr:hypothetical protein GCM10010336_35160 [Streptomyces goshikiensis]